jgi:pimeloyl-ACP methyl ester carboxylesterase
MDWLGRGLSGWLADEREYGLPTYVEQLDQLLRHLGGRPATLLGSSMGGSVAIAYAAARPKQVEALVLNDVGPAIPRARRARRAQALARFYVFRTPQDLLRRIGAAHKNDGPIDDELRLFLAWHQTRWSAENGGRVYRHDPRAFLAYQRDAQRSVDQWAEWQRVDCPVLLLHGMLSDTLLPRTMARMQRTRPLTLAHIPGTGHAPVLAAPGQAAFIHQWLGGPRTGHGECSIF